MNHFGAVALDAFTARTDVAAEAAIVRVVHEIGVATVPHVAAVVGNTGARIDIERLVFAAGHITATIVFGEVAAVVALRLGIGATGDDDRSLIAPLLTSGRGATVGALAEAGITSNTVGNQARDRLTANIAANDATGTVPAGTGVTAGVAIARIPSTVAIARIPATVAIPVPGAGIGIPSRVRATATSGIPSSVARHRRGGIPRLTIDGSPGAEIEIVRSAEDTGRFATTEDEIVSGRSFERQHLAAIERNAQVQRATDRLTDERKTAPIAGIETTVVNGAFVADGEIQRPGVDGVLVWTDRGGSLDLERTNLLCSGALQTKRGETSGQSSGSDTAARPAARQGTGKRIKTTGVHEASLRARRTRRIAALRWRNSARFSISVEMECCKHYGENYAFFGRTNREVEKTFSSVFSGGTSLIHWAAWRRSCHSTKDIGAMPSVI